MEAWLRRRFKLAVNIRIYPRDSPVVRCETVDISESGMSAMIRVEVPLGELVRLEFSLPAGPVEVLAVTQQRNAFRYGFQFKRFPKKGYSSLRMQTCAATASVRLAARESFGEPFC